jgi:hypothetical protein
MPDSDYSFNGFCDFTISIRNRSAQLIHGRQQSIEAAFDAIIAHLGNVSRRPFEQHGNVDLVEGCAFFNHVYAALQLAESGMSGHAALSARKGVEMVAIHWLYQFDWLVARARPYKRPPQPLEVIGRLEDLGIDVSPLEGLYAICNELTRPGADHRHCTEDGPERRELNIGGCFSPADQKRLIGMVPDLINLYLDRPDLAAPTRHMHYYGTARMPVPEGKRTIGEGSHPLRSGRGALRKNAEASRLASSMSDEKFERLRVLAEATSPETVKRFKEMARRVGREQLR